MTINNPMIAGFFMAQLNPAANPLVALQF
jgi:hypothetical protein